MKYKISDEQVKLREYGRNVQEMVKYCKILPDDHERNVLAREIIRIMANMNPNLGDGADYQAKLWDHFYHLADYDIDVDSDFAIPEPGEVFSRPTERMVYHNKRSRYRQYGQNIELMAEAAMDITDDPDRKHALVTMTLNIMKMHLKGVEKDSNAEAIVCEHMRVLTKGELTYSPDDIRFQRYATAPPIQQPSSNYQGQGGGGRKNSKGGGGKRKGGSNRHNNRGRR